MAAEVVLHPIDDRERLILDELERQTEVKPMEVMADGARGYYLSAADADVNAFDLMLDEINSDWRDHVTNLAAH
jgi:hypothetical protein